MMEELVLSYPRGKADLRKSQQALDRLNGNLGIIGAFEKIEQAETQSRREREITAKRWNFGKDEPLNPVKR
jgi:hypothetical protein